MSLKASRAGIGVPTVGIAVIYLLISVWNLVGPTPCPAPCSAPPSATHVQGRRTA